MPSAERDIINSLRNAERNKVNESEYYEDQDQGDGVEEAEQLGDLPKSTKKKVDKSREKEAAKGKKKAQKGKVSEEEEGEEDEDREDIDEEEEDEDDEKEKKKSKVKESTNLAKLKDVLRYLPESKKKIAFDLVESLQEGEDDDEDEDEDEGEENLEEAHFDTKKVANLLATGDLKPNDVALMIQGSGGDHETWQGEVQASLNAIMKDDPKKANLLAGKVKEAMIKK